MPRGMLIDWATAIVEPLEIVPMMTLTLSMSASLVAASTAGGILDWSSCESTIWTE